MKPRFVILHHDYSENYESGVDQEMGIGEYILSWLSRDPECKDYSAGSNNTDLEDALDILDQVYPNLDSLVSGKRVLDYGCGKGYQCIALVREYGCSVVGIDSNYKELALARSSALVHGAPKNKLFFSEKVMPDMLGGFDIVISQNSFEHFSEPEKTLREMVDVLKDNGKILITFGPPWFAPYGSHMGFFCRVPWLNILFSERVVMNVRKRFRNDGATRYEEVESGLNRMTVGRFEHIIYVCSLKTEYFCYECVKGMNWLSRVPILRELFINRITVILSKSGVEERDAVIPGGPRIPRRICKGV